MNRIYYFIYAVLLVWGQQETAGVREGASVGISSSCALSPAVRVYEPGLKSLFQRTVQEDEFSPWHELRRAGAIRFEQGSLLETLLHELRLQITSWQKNHSVTVVFEDREMMRQLFPDLTRAEYDAHLILDRGIPLGLVLSQPVKRYTYVLDMTEIAALSSPEISLAGLKTALEKRLVLAGHISAITSRMQDMSSFSLQFAGLSIPVFSSEYDSHNTASVMLTQVALEVVAPAMRVLEIGTGPGFLSGMLAQRIGCRVEGIDVRRSALMNAKMTMRWLGVEDKVTLFESDLFDNIPDGQTYDAMFFSPPGEQPPFLWTSPRAQVAELDDEQIERMFDRLFGGLRAVLSRGGALYMVVLKGDRLVRERADAYGLDVVSVASHSSDGGDNFDIVKIQPREFLASGFNGLRPPETVTVSGREYEIIARRQVAEALIIIARSGGEEALLWEDDRGIVTLVPRHQYARIFSGEKPVCGDRTEQDSLREYLVAAGNGDTAVDRVLSLLDSSRVILEIGCGHAAFADLIAERNPQISVIATDSFPEVPESPEQRDSYHAIALAWQRGEITPRQDNMAVVRAEADVLRVIPDNSLEAILFVNPDPATVVRFLRDFIPRQWHRKLTAGGKIIIKPFATDDFLHQTPLSFVAEDAIQLGVDLTDSSLGYNEHSRFWGVFTWQLPDTVPPFSLLPDVYIGQSI